LVKGLGGKSSTFYISIVEKFKGFDIIVDELCDGGFSCMNVDAMNFSELLHP
jgi:uncharacterized protein YmfQ (DUF2313 family)